MNDARQRIGRAAEDLAAAYYAAEGFALLDRRCRLGRGELDLVVRRGDLLVFVEVKARRGSGWGDPSEAAPPWKLRRLRSAARRWLAEHAPRGVEEFRFDLAAVRLSPAGDGCRLEILAGIT